MSYTDGNLGDGSQSGGGGWLQQFMNAIGGAGAQSGYGVPPGGPQPGPIGQPGLPPGMPTRPATGMAPGGVMPGGMPNTDLSVWQQALENIRRRMLMTPGLGGGAAGNALTQVDPRLAAAGSGGFNVPQPMGAPPFQMPARPVSRPYPTPFEPNFPLSAPGANSPTPGQGAPRGNPAPTPRPAGGPRAATPQPAGTSRSQDPTPNLGYYQARTGNARSPVFNPQGDPRFYGPLSSMFGRG
jgi:hypothetical protein